MPKVLSPLFRVWRVVRLGIAEVDMVNVSAKELGLTGATVWYGDICSCGLDRGLQLCSEELRHQLCLQYKEQPDGERLRIAIEMLFGSSIDYRIIREVYPNPSRRDIGKGTGCPDGFYNADDRFIFVQPRD